MSHYHAVVWLDNSQAHVMHIVPDDVEKSVLYPAKPHAQLVAYARKYFVAKDRMLSQL